MGLQLFSGPSWEEDSFNETNVQSVLQNAAEMRLKHQPWLKDDLDYQHYLREIYEEN